MTVHKQQVKDNKQEVKDNKQHTRPRDNKKEVHEVSHSSDPFPCCCYWAIVKGTKGLGYTRLVEG